MKITNATTLDDLKALPPGSLVVWAIHTCWWNVPDLTSVWYKKEIPVDPRGSPLMEGELGRFLAYAESNPDHYGKFGLKTLMAAFHGNLLSDNDKPTSLESWEDYEKLLENSP